MLRPHASWLRARAIIAFACLAVPLSAMSAQGTRWDEAWVGSEAEVYLRMLAVRGAIPDEPWSIRPLGPRILTAWRAGAPRLQPWVSRMSPAPSPAFVHVLRPAVFSSFNTGFPWGMNDGPAWQGRGLNVWATAGIAGSWRFLSARLEPFAERAANRPFRLEGAGSNPSLQDALRPGSIDLPQRLGYRAATILDPGESFVRADVWKLSAGFTTQKLFWGPGVRHAVLFDGNAAGFPRLFAGTNEPASTPLGRVHGQVVYGRLEESHWAPSAPTPSRFGSGIIGVWMPPHLPIEVGGARFYHREWPKHFGKSELLAPLGSFFVDRQVRGSGAVDNQLASLFFSARIPRAAFEVFGEFARNDRSVDSRDLALETEHNSAWLFGFNHVFHVDSLDSSMWSARLEVANGRIPSLQNIGRGQSTFYEHSRITQGHTERGQILGTPLIDRSGGAEFALDHWTHSGRVGLAVIERQMPSDEAVGMPMSSARSQWDLGVSSTRFRGPSDISLQLGYVRDFNRFPGTDVGNVYLRLAFRAGEVPRKLHP